MADAGGIFGSWTPRNGSGPPLGVPCAWKNRVCPINQVVLYRWYLKRLEEYEGDNPGFVRVAVGGYTDLKPIETGRFETSAIEQRIEKCKLKTIDGLYVVLEGGIDVQCTYHNGFSFEVISTFCTGFPFIWKHVINDYFCAQENILSSTCSNTVRQDSQALNTYGMQKDNESMGDVEDKHENRTQSIVVDLTQKEIEDDIATVTDSLKREATDNCRNQEKCDGMGSQRPSQPGQVAYWNQHDGLPGNSVDLLEQNRDKITCVDDKVQLETREENTLDETNDQPRRRKRDSWMLPPHLPSRRVKTTPEEVSAAFGLKTSRSGRLLVPPLAHWLGETIAYDWDGGIIAIFDRSDVAGFNFQPPKQLKARRMQQKLCHAANKVIVISKGKKKKHTR